jgi:hypothetical protein
MASDIRWSLPPPSVVLSDELLTHVDEILLFLYTTGLKIMTGTEPVPNRDLKSVCSMIGLNTTAPMGTLITAFNMWFVVYGKLLGDIFYNSADLLKVGQCFGESDKTTGEWKLFIFNRLNHEAVIADIDYRLGLSGQFGGVPLGVVQYIKANKDTLGILWASTQPPLNALLVSSIKAYNVIFTEMKMEHRFSYNGLPKVVLMDELHRARSAICTTILNDVFKDSGISGFLIN